MSVNIDRKTLRNIARKTLGRSEIDERPISAVYIAHLRHFLASYPDEQDFTIDLDNGGSVFCRVCEWRLPPGNGEPEEDGKDILGSMSNFEEHLKSDVHYCRKVLVSQSNPHSASLAEAMPGHSVDANSQHLIDLTHSPSSSERQIPSASTNSVALRQEIDEDYLLALKLDEEMNGPNREEIIGEQQRLSLSSLSLEEDERSNLSVSQPSITHQRETAPLYETEENEEEFPFEETYHAQIQGILHSSPGEEIHTYHLYRESPRVIRAKCKICHFSVAMPGCGSFEKVFDDVHQCVQAYEEHLRSPIHIRKRNEAVIQSSHQPLKTSAVYQDIFPDMGAESSNIVPEAGSEGTRKRKLPGSWLYGNEIDEAGNQVSPSAVDNRNRDFVSASAVGQMVHRPTGFDGQTPPRVVERLTASSGSGSSPNSAHEMTIRHFQESGAAMLNGYGSHRGMNAGDFKINYDNSGPMGTMDVAGLDLDKRFKDFMHKALEEFKDVATVTDAQKKLNLRSENDLLDGMQVRLLPHQIIGVAWMIDQEKNEEKHGGILADAMGLGKTIQMIATMVYNPPLRAPEDTSFEPHRAGKGKGKQVEYVGRTTLVLAPASLLQQWYEELGDKTQPGVFRVHIHHGKDKLKTVQQIEEYDVIIASHQSVIMDFPKGKKKEPFAQEDDDDTSDIPIADRETLGPLAKVQWFRIIIDEAQSIRNRSTRLSMCVAKLNSRYRWCLTGTPITNTLADIFGFMRFCRFAPWNDWALFNEKVARLQKRNPSRAGQKAQAILKPHLLRRTKDSTIDGLPIIRLGPKIIDMVELEFMPEERVMYSAVETSQKKIVSRFLREGTVMKNYSFILVMILRLRQLCCHPSLATAEAKTEELNEEERKNELARVMRLMGADKVEEIRIRVKARILDRMKACLDEEESDIDDCPICMEPIVDDRRVTSCAHEYCSVCINEVLQKAEGENLEDGARCPLCRALLDRSRIFSGKIFEPSGEEIEKMRNDLAGTSSSAPSSERPLKKSKIECLPESRVIGEDDEINLTRLDKHKFEPSTKMRRMLESVMQWKAENPGDKTIVYSQWTSMLDLVENYLRDSGIDVLRYDGRMNRLARVESIARFKKPDGPSVILVSLKCGGVGLNLTVANRVINLDLAWNYATEAQAYDRVHRLGQQKPVNIHRLIIRDTIEERMIRLQAKKQGLSDAALGEGTGNKLQRMTARDIAQLFDLA